MTWPAAARRLADRLEQIIWGDHDAELRAIGFQVTRISWWQRSYRPPVAVQAAIDRARAAERQAANRKPVRWTW